MSRLPVIVYAKTTGWHRCHALRLQAICVGSNPSAAKREIRILHPFQSELKSLKGMDKNLSDQALCTAWPPSKRNDMRLSNSLHLTETIYTDEAVKVRVEPMEREMVISR